MTICHEELSPMSSPSTPARRRTAGLALVLAVGVGGLVACGDDDEPTSSDDTTTTTVGEGSPEDVKVPLEAVVAGLPGIKQAGDAAATAAGSGDFDAALDLYDDLHEAWEGVEGTLKDTDEDTYEAIETAQGLIKDGAENENAERVAEGAAAQAEAIDAFIAANS
jgi:ABC-type glycerol-3-phosphate transport system substrate-binding protein